MKKLIKIFKFISKLFATGFLIITGGTVYFFNKAIVRKSKPSIKPADVFIDTTHLQLSEVSKSGKEWLKSQKTEQIFINAFDGLKLAATYLPAKIPHKKILLAVHGYTGSGLNDFAGYSQFYHELGYDMLMVDNRAHGDSEGKYMGLGVLDRIDCAFWIQYLNDRFGSETPIILHGISMGAATVLMTSGLDLPANIKAIISDCGFTSPFEIFKHVIRRNYHLPPFPLLYTSDFLCKKIAGYGYREYSTLNAMTTNTIPVFFIHGEQDDFVPVEMTKQNYNACTAEKYLWIVPDAEHAASHVINSAEYEKHVKDFLAHFVP